MVKKIKTPKKLNLNTATVRDLQTKLTEEQLKQANGGRSGACSMDGCGTEMPNEIC